MSLSEKFLLLIGFVQLLIAIGVFWLNIQAHRKNKKDYSLNYEKYLVDVWNISNQATLSDPENLKLKIGDFDFIQNEEEMRKAYLSFLELNAIYVTYVGWQNREVSDEHLDKALAGVLDRIMRNDIGYSCSQRVGYSEDFKTLCGNRRQKILKEQTIANQD